MQVVPNPLQCVVQYETVTNIIQLVFALQEHLREAYKMRVPYLHARQMLLSSALRDVRWGSPVSEVTVALDSQYDF